MGMRFLLVVLGIVMSAHAFAERPPDHLDGLANGTGGSLVSSAGESIDKRRYWIEDHPNLYSLDRYLQNTLVSLKRLGKSGYELSCTGMFIGRGPGQELSSEVARGIDHENEEFIAGTITFLTAGHCTPSCSGGRHCRLSRPSRKKDIPFQAGVLTSRQYIAPRIDHAVLSHIFDSTSPYAINFSEARSPTIRWDAPPVGPGYITAGYGNMRVLSNSDIRRAKPIVLEVLAERKDATFPGLTKALTDAIDRKIERLGDETFKPLFKDNELKIHENCSVKRIIGNSAETDCLVFPGDSGAPLLSMSGNRYVVNGISSEVVIRNANEIFGEPGGNRVSKFIVPETYAAEVQSLLGLPPSARLDILQRPLDRSHIEQMKP